MTLTKLMCDVIATLRLALDKIEVLIDYNHAVVHEGTRHMLEQDLGVVAEAVLIFLLDEQASEFALNAYQFEAPV